MKLHEIALALSLAVAPACATIPIPKNFKKCPTGYSLVEAKRPIFLGLRETITACLSNSSSSIEKMQDKCRKKGKEVGIVIHPGKYAKWICGEPKPKE